MESLVNSFKCSAIFSTRLISNRLVLGESPVVKSLVSAL